MSKSHTSTKAFVRERRTGPYWYAKWRRDGKQVMRALGPAWVRRDGDGWKNRRGEPTGGALTEREANAMLEQLIAHHDTEQAQLEHDAEERRLRGITSASWWTSGSCIWSERRAPSRRRSPTTAG